MYQPRTYRHWVKSQDLVAVNVVVEETDLHIRAATDLHREALMSVLKYRDILKRYIQQHPSFLTSLEPLATDDDAPHIVKSMLESASKVGVGPMATVAGAIAEFVGYDLLAFSPEIIVENGGDIFLKSASTRQVGIYAGSSPLSGKIGLEINGADTPLGICSSSGTVGHSLSYGKADAVVVLSQSAILADAAATAIGNLVTNSDTITNGIEFARGITELTGVVIIKDTNIGIWGEVKITQTVA